MAGVSQAAPFDLLGDREILSTSPQHVQASHWAAIENWSRVPTLSV